MMKNGMKGTDDNMYQFTATERNNARASEYETKSMLYLFGCRKDSKAIDVFIIDCFNDVSGADKDVHRIWDVQSKGVKSLNPTKVGKAIYTLFENYISDIDFEHYILFMPKLVEKYLIDENKKCYGMDNFKTEYVDKVKQGLANEYKRRNGKEADINDIAAFLQIVEFVIAEEEAQEYIKKITSFQTSLKLKSEFYNEVFKEIKKEQMDKKNINVEGYQIVKASEVLKFNKALWKKDIDELIITRIFGMNISNPRLVPIEFMDEIATLDVEERKDVIQECQSDIAKLLFDKNGRITFWKFFGKVLFYIKQSKLQKPREIADKIKKDNVMIPKTLNEMSVLYLISSLREGIENVN